MFRSPIRIPHLSPKSFLPVGLDTIPKEAQMNIEEIEFNHVQYGHFYREVRRQWEEITVKGFQPQVLMIGLKDYRNLIVEQQNGDPKEYMGMKIVVLPEEGANPRILLSARDSLTVAFFGDNERDAT